MACNCILVKCKPVLHFVLHLSAAAFGDLKRSWDKALVGLACL